MDDLSQRVLLSAHLVGVDSLNEEDKNQTMYLQKFDPSWAEKYTAKYWYDFLCEKYMLTDFPKNHFEYIDAGTFIECTENEFEEMNSIVRKVNGIFRTAYVFYFENLEKNLPDFI